MADVKNLSDILQNTRKNSFDLDEEEILKEIKANPYILAKVKELDLTDRDIIKNYPILATYGEEHLLAASCPGPEACQPLILYRT